jgi:hypothetical protein
MAKSKKPKFRTSYKKAVGVAQAAVGMVSLRNPPLNKKDLFPDTIPPKGVEVGSREHAQYQFCGCSIDSMRLADQVYKAVRDLAEKVGDLSKIHLAKKSLVTTILESHFGEGIHNAMGKPVETTMGNSQRLADKYGGDPREIWTGKISTTIKALQKFKQFGPGKAALLMKNYVRFGVWDAPEYEIPIKIDRHAMRISLGTGVITPTEEIKIRKWNGSLSKALNNAKELLIRQGQFSREDFDTGRVAAIRSSGLILPLTKLYQRVCKEYKISAIDLDDSMWAIGAHLCKRNDAIYCHTNCQLGCSTRYASDNGAIYFFEGEKRRNPTNLFNHHQEKPKKAKKRIKN